ncbi:hypothetical protein [Polymorphobacter fuscus]|uniref:Uncharacterized protein n=1 Tax=Sandarakinorhabdus fusca TaxID=1439888 RepID=A0A7C9GP57_9SPHN|nr:hypothetical protein [Polymorphobacter fuscus]KAB7647460.1 hypothetical protein F9290_05520 [Polymorphobacter fuscus]MQT16716.1 hypothetical protein [Polymorphobacter fuscus]NJC09297.1 hypothetical protein [Polymorphobacter fuscus]
MLRNVPAASGAVDAGDLALLFELRRIGMMTTLLPGSVGWPRAFATDKEAPLAALANWATAPERQAEDGSLRLHNIPLSASPREPLSE